MQVKRRYSNEEAEQYRENNVPDNPDDWTYSDYRNELLWLVSWYAHRRCDLLPLRDCVSCISGSPVGSDNLRGTLEYAETGLEKRLNAGEEMYNEQNGVTVEDQREAEQRLLRLVKALKQVDYDDYWFDSVKTSPVSRTVSNALTVRVYKLTDKTSCIVAQYKNTASMVVSYQDYALFTRNVGEKIVALQRDLPGDFEEKEVADPVSTDALLERMSQ